MPKFFVKANQIENNKIIIMEEDVNHMIHVLRLAKEDEIFICNVDTGDNYIGVIENIQKDSIQCDIKEKLKSSAETNINITIFQGLPKSDKMELIIQKATEIGVKEIVPVNMKRCVVKLEQKEIKKKIDRWQKIAETASKQSMRDYIPRIKNVIDMKEIYDKIGEYDLFLIAYENEKEITLKQVLRKNKLPSGAKIGVFIGPEGGIDESEIANLKNYGVHIITLGNRILRTETVALVMSSIIIYELD